MAVRLKCPECRESFPWDTNKPWPANCPLCRYDTSLPPGDEVVMPAIFTSGKTKAADNVYRAMEKGADVRVEAAAEMTGLPKSEFSDLKITDMKDNMRPGENALAPVSNAVTQHMDAMKGRGLPTGFGSNGAQYSGAVQSGPFPNAGAKMMDVVRSKHSASGGVTSSMPALETLSPNYRPRT